MVCKLSFLSLFFIQIWNWRLESKDASCSMLIKCSLKDMNKDWWLDMHELEYLPKLMDKHIARQRHRHIFYMLLRQVAIGKLKLKMTPKQTKFFKTFPNSIWPDLKWKEIKKNFPPGLNCIFFDLARNRVNILPDKKRKDLQFRFWLFQSIKIKGSDPLPQMGNFSGFKHSLSPN